MVGHPSIEKEVLWLNTLGHFSLNVLWLERNTREKYLDQFLDSLSLAALSFYAFGQSEELFIISFGLGLSSPLFFCTFNTIYKIILHLKNDVRN